MSDVLVERSEGQPRHRIALWSLSPGKSATARALATLKTVLPIRRDDFERRLAEALEVASTNGSGFYLKGFSARRALGTRLVIEIDPLRVKQRLSHRLPAEDLVYLQDRFVGAGNWNAILKPLSASATHRDVQEIVRKGLDYRKTEAYLHAIERSRGPKPVRRNFVALRSPQLVEAYFRNVVDLCRSLSENGVERRADHRSFTGVFRRWNIRLPWVELMEADIGLAIGPGGEIFHFGSGKHRIAAAQALGLKSVPVEARMVHAAWLERQIASSGLPAAEALLAGIRSLALARPESQAAPQ